MRVIGAGPTAARAVTLAVLVAAACRLPAATVGADPEPPLPPPLATVIDRDGSYVVGTDIAPGVYRSAGAAGSGACYWKRVRGDKIVDNALTKKPQLVQIEPTDTVFKTHRCQPWRQTECPPDCAPAPEPPPTLPDGVRDLLPGLPQSPAGR